MKNCDKRRKRDLLILSFFLWYFLLKHLGIRASYSHCERKWVNIEEE